MRACSDEAITESEETTDIEMIYRYGYNSRGKARWVAQLYASQQLHIPADAPERVGLCDSDAASARIKGHVPACPTSQLESPSLRPLSSLCCLAA
jgi:hypothetical protein